MTKDPDDKSPENFTHATQVDLGEDLIVVTQVKTREVWGPSASQSPEDQFETARILMNEGLLEDAKKTLRKILIHDPDHMAAQLALKEILDRELKELLTDSGPVVRRPRVFERKGMDARSPLPTTDELLKSLEEVLGNGDGTPMTPPLTLAIVEENGTATHENDRIDLGIAFLEMGIYPKAVEQFRLAVSMLESRPELDVAKKISAVALIARALIEADLAFEACQALHPMLRDGDIPAPEKIEHFYLMGVAHEKLGDRRAALPWFAKVRELDPQYRDVMERLRKPLG